MITNNYVPKVLKFTPMDSPPLKPELVVRFILGLNSDILATIPADPDIFASWLASKCPEEAKMADEIAAAKAQAEGLTEAERKELAGATIFRTVTKAMAEKDPSLQEGQFVLAAYMFKGYLKAAASALAKMPGTKASTMKAFKKNIVELIFMDPAHEYVVIHGPNGLPLTKENLGFCQRPLRSSGPTGERTSIARSQTAPAGSMMQFDVQLMRAGDKEFLLELMSYGFYQGLGQWRNSGKGTFGFNVVPLTDEENKALCRPISKPKEKASAEETDHDQAAPGKGKIAVPDTAEPVLA